MQRNHLLNFHNDSKLNKLPPEKQLQPLFKKKFVFDQSLLQKHLKSQSEARQEGEQILSISETSSKPTDTTFNIRKNLVGFRKDGSNAPTDNVKEDLETMVQRLKSEKLEVLKDLWTYEDKFTHKYCLRARISEIKQLSADLLRMSESAYERISCEKELFDYLQLGLIALHDEKFTYESSDEEELDEAETDDYVIMHALDISGSICISFAKVNEDSGVELTVYPKDFRCAVFLHITDGFRLPSFRIGKSLILQELKNQVYPKLKLVSRAEELILEYDPAVQDGIHIICNPKG